MPGLKFILFAIISFLFIFFDHRSPYFHAYRDQLSAIVLPLQELVNVPTQMVRWFVADTANRRQLVEDNERLRVRELLLEAKLQRLLALEQENKQLHQLLQSTPQIAGKVLVAQLLAVDLDPAFHQVIIDKGARNHLYIGQPVLDAYGVAGQVISINPLTSKVLLLTDTRSAIPVKDYRNGVRAIAIGSGNMELSVINVLDTVDVRVGDLFVTSGLGLRFPADYPVGVVTKVERAPGERFIKIVLAPSSTLDKTQQVLLVWPDKAELRDQVERLLEQPIPSIHAVPAFITAPVPSINSSASTPLLPSVTGFRANNH